MSLFTKKKLTLLSAVWFTVAVALLSGCGEDDGLESGTFTDARDNKTYKTTKIGDKTWMADNLNYQTSDGSWCYDGGNKYCEKYGRLYDWNTAVGVCPSGWHLPSRAEWSDLIAASGGFSTAGKALKSFTGWSGYGGGVDTYNFWALPGGKRDADGVFAEVGIYGLWWSATEYDDSNALLAIMCTKNDSANVKWSGKAYGVSVRCIND